MQIGVCGSLGRISTVKFAHAVLSQKYKTISTKPDKDSISNILVTLLKLNPSHKKAILELGSFSKQNIAFYNSLIRPKVVILTKIDPKEEYFGTNSESLEEIGNYLALLSVDSFVIFNWDDINNRKLAQKTQANVIFYGTDQKNCTIWGGNIRIENFKTNFELNLGVERVKVELPVIGLHNVYCALAAACLGAIHKIPLTKIKIALESIKEEDHQMQVMMGPNNSYILDDTFDSTPIEIESAIDTLMKIPARRRILVLGDVTNPSMYTFDDYRKIAEKIFAEKLDIIFFGVGKINQTAEELLNLGFWEERVEPDLQNSQLVSRLLKTLGKGDVCLIKASKTIRLSEVVKRIAKKN